MIVSKVCAGILIGLCLLTIIVTPVAATPQENTGKGKEQMISEGLKSDLWNIHKNYRMQFFQLRVERANAINQTLAEHGCDVGSLETAVQQIEDHEDSLRQALKDKDRRELREINQELVQLWREFRKGVRESVRTCRGVTE
ncbi:MAG: hypothetical protein LUO82_00885 [Methanomicrobiales archaeon]|nr:hypothetical protein [Methanomicrobiales archaeon]